MHRSARDFGSLNPLLAASLTSISTSTIMASSVNTRLPVGNKNFTNATIVIIGAGISGMLDKLTS